MASNRHMANGEVIGMGRKKLDGTGGLAGMTIKQATALAGRRQARIDALQSLLREARCPSENCREGVKHRWSQALAGYSGMPYIYQKPTGDCDWCAKRKALLEGE